MAAQRPRPPGQSQIDPRDGAVVVTLPPAPAALRGWRC